MSSPSTSPRFTLHAPLAAASVFATLTLGGLANPASAACPAEGPVTCTRYNNRLVIEGDAGKLVLEGSWSANDGTGRYHTDDGFTIAVPGGVEFPVPGVGGVTVTCSPFLAIEGELTSLPDLGSFWPDSMVEASQPTIHMGMALGEQISDLDVPVDPCSPYLFFALQSSVSYSFGGAEVGIVEGDNIKFLLDPWDPGFVFEVGGQRLAQASGNFVQRIGLGVSNDGNLAWESAIPLPSGIGANAFANKTVAEIAGHVWFTGKFGLIPIPDLPVQLTLDGDVVVDLGTWPRLAGTVLGAIASGQAADIQSIVAAETDNATALQIMNRVAIGVNVNALSIAMEFLSIDFARGSLVVDDGKLRFAAEAWTPGEGIDGEGGGSGVPLIDAALAAIVVKTRLGASGYVDANGYRFELAGNFQIGPLTIDNAKLIIDSDEGVSVERPDLKFDPVAFVEQLKQMFSCDFAHGLATCRVGGFPVLNVNATIQNGDVKMGVKLDLFGISNAAFQLVRRADGDFEFELSVTRLPAAFVFALVDAKLVIKKSGVKIEAKLDRILSNERFAGSISRANGQIRFAMSYQGKTTFAGFPGVDVQMNLSNTAGPVRLTASAEFRPAQYTAFFQGSAIKLNGSIDTNGQFSLSGQGALIIAGYPLANLAVALSNIPGQDGFTMEGNFDAKAVHVRLRGTYKRSEGVLVLSGTNDLTIDGYHVAGAAFTLSSASGMSVSGKLNLGVIQFALGGQVSPAGDVNATASMSVSIPITLGLREIVRAAYCVGNTLNNAGQCTGGMLYNTVSVFEEHWSCTAEPILSCTEAIVHRVTDTIYKVGSCIDEAVTCGLQTVTDGLKCGFKVMEEKIPLAFGCAGEMIACAFTMGHEWCTYNPPQSCLAVSEPRTCQALAGCDPVACERVTEWTTPAQCTQIGTKLGSCWHDVQVEIPGSCNNIPAQQCYPDEFGTVDHVVGYFTGAVSITLGSTLAATVSGSYWDVWGTNAAWSATGSMDVAQSGQSNVCIDVPRAALPWNALVASNDPTMQRLCMPL